MDTCDDSHQVFTTSWFVNTNIDWDNYIPLDKSTKTCLEIGAFEGMSATYMTNNYCAVVDTIDTFQGGAGYNQGEDLFENMFDRFYNNMKCYIQSGAVNVHVGESRKILPKFILENRTYDYIY